MKSFSAFILLTAALALLMLALIGFQNRLIIERLDILERQYRTCDAPVDETATPQREPWPEVL